MDSAMIGKIEKAKRYAEEPDRLKIQQLQVEFKGDHDSHQVSFKDGSWTCDCRFFAQRGVCTHTMTIERVLGDWLAGITPIEEMEN